MLHSFVDPLDSLEQTPFNTATERTRDVIEVREWKFVDVNNHMTSPPHVIQSIVWPFQSGSLISEEYLMQISKMGSSQGVSTNAGHVMRLFGVETPAQLLWMRCCLIFECLAFFSSVYYDSKLAAHMEFREDVR